MAQKTIKEWLSELPEPYRTQSLMNHENHPSTPLLKSHDSFMDAIEDGFLWGQTPEGTKYWMDVSEKIDKGKLPIAVPQTAISAIHAISLKLGFPAEDIIAIKPHTNAPHGKWEYMLRESNEWIFIDLSNP